MKWKKIASTEYGKIASSIPFHTMPWISEYWVLFFTQTFRSNVRVCEYFVILKIWRSFLRLREGNFRNCIQKHAELFQFLFFFFFLVIETEIVNFFFNNSLKI